MDMLRQWGSTLERACESIIADIHAGKLLDSTMEKHYDYLRHLMGRREIIVNEIMKYDRHKGPGTPWYHDLGNRVQEEGTTSSGASRHLSLKGKAFGEEAGGDVDH